jgi:hypothetical protein
MSRDVAVVFIAYVVPFAIIAAVALLIRWLNRPRP